MSAILSADDLNDFIAPGIACIKPIEPLPPPPQNVYEVHNEDKPPLDAMQPAQISLTDCLACSGCVTSAEALLVSLQSHTEVLDALEKYKGKKKFVGMVSPQSKASLAATLGLKVSEVGNMVERCLYEVGFDWVVDLELGRQIALEYAVQEVVDSLADQGTKKPILTSACPGFICYVESTHPYLIPHLSRLKSPQAITGTFVKSMLPKELGLEGPESIYLVAIMPCFDKKLEGSRTELTSAVWGEGGGEEPVRDVDCVITTRELLSLAQAKDIELDKLDRNTPKAPTQLPSELAFILSNLPVSPSPAPIFNPPLDETMSALGTSDGYLFHILARLQELHPGSLIRMEKGRNSDTVEFVLYKDGETITKLARSYGFRNIQNLVRKLKPPKPLRALPKFGKGKVVQPRREKKAEGLDYSYVEVMACPGGCTNGGGQIKYDDEHIVDKTSSAREWQSKVDETYFSGSTSRSASPSPEPQANSVQQFVDGWAKRVDVESGKLVFTTYREIQDEFAKQREKEKDATARAAELATKAGGGW